MTTIGRRRFLLGLSLAPLAGLGGRALAQNKIMQWGSSSLGSTGYQIITVLAATASQHTEDRHASLSTAGGAENMALLRERMIDFGQTTTTDWQPAINGTGRYDGSPVDAVQLFSYMVWQCTPMVRADADIQSLADLAGKRVMPAAAGGATNGLFQTYFEAAGLKDAVEWTYGSWSETYDALAAGAVDCIPSLLTAGTPSGLLQRLETNTAVRALPIDEQALAAAKAANPGVMSSTVTPETWPALENPAELLSFAGVLATHADTGAEVVYNVTRAIFENLEFVKQKGGAPLQFLSLENASRFLMPAYPVHAGAAQYLKEQGVWNDELKIHG